MIKLKKDYITTYNEISCKLITLFTVFILFLIFRFLLYIDIEYLKIFIDDTVAPEVKAIPFYISEIAITLTISYILFSISKRDRENSANL